MRRVVIESPYAGDTARNVAYARTCVADCLRRGEAPFASHLLYPQPGVLDDGDEDERRIGMEAGFRWAECAELTAVYQDLGLSHGMEVGIRRAREVHREVTYRTLGKDWGRG